MKYLSTSLDGARLTLAIPESAPLRAAAAAVRGARFEGTSDGVAIFSFPALAEVWADLRLAFDPQVDDGARATVERLEKQATAVAGAVAAKGAGEPLSFNPLLRTVPMAHQVEALNFAWRLFTADQPGAALLMEQGTGKSLVSVGLANGLHAAGLIRWVLVVAPNSLKGTWGAEDGEVLKHGARPAALTILRGPRARRLEQAHAALARWQAPDALTWLVCNVEMFADQANLAALAPMLEAAGPGLLILDESTTVKNPRAKRTRSLLALAQRCRFRLILTGTPITKSPLDAWAQFQVLGPGSLGFASFLSFERAYAITQRQQVGRGTSARSFVAVTGYRNLDDLERRVARLSYRVRAQDCLDLPPVTVQRVPVEISTEQGMLLQDLRTQMMAELDGATLDGRNILTRYLRMAEVLGGFPHFLDADGQPAGVRPLTPNPKLDAAREFLRMALDDPDHKAVVFAQFRAEVVALQELARAHGWEPVAFHGDVSERDRDAGRQRFQTDPACRVFVAQYQTGSKGLNLTTASTALFYSLTFSLEDFLQARKRVHRMGQERPVLEAYLVAEWHARGGRLRATLDQVMLQALENKRTLADLVTGDAARALLEDVA